MNRGLFTKPLAFLTAFAIFASPIIGARTAYGTTTQKSADSDDSLDIKYQVNDLRSATAKPAIGIDIVTKTIQPNEVANEIIKADHDSSIHGIVVSSDLPDVLEQSEAAGQLVNAHDTKLIVAPIGDASPFNDQPRGFNQRLRSYARDHIAKSLANPIGVMIVTYSMGVESFQWIHAANVSGFEKSANIAYSMATALAFTINSGAWAKATQPVQKAIRRKLKMDENISYDRSFKNVGIKFLASLALSLPLNLGRVPLLSVDQFMNHTLSLANVAGSVEVAAFAAAMSTVTGLGWSEFGSEVHDRSLVSKLIGHSMINGKNILIGTLATTAMLFNYDHYGVSPWIVIGTTGAVGWSMFFDAGRILNWIENLPWIAKVRKFWWGSGTCQGMFG